MIEVGAKSLQETCRQRSLQCNTQTKAEFVAIREHKIEESDPATRFWCCVGYKGAKESKHLQCCVIVCGAALRFAEPSDFCNFYLLQ